MTKRNLENREPLMSETTTLSQADIFSRLGIFNPREAIESFRNLFNFSQAGKGDEFTTYNAHREFWDTHNEQNFAFWERFKFSGEKKGPATAYEIDFANVAYQAANINKIQVVEIPKTGAEKSADVVFMSRLRTGQILIFVGDGIFPADAPPGELDDLLQKFNCQARPDALIPELLHDQEFLNYIFVASRFAPDGYGLRKAETFIATLQSAMQRLYLGNGFSLEQLEQIEKAKLPSLVGTACIISSNGEIDIAAIGDGQYFYVDGTNHFQEVTQPQNVRFDELTKEKINEYIENHAGEFVEVEDKVAKARASAWFKDWLKKTYEAKINVPGGVSAVNGKGNLSAGFRHVTLHAADLQSVTISTDGLTLGRKSAPGVKKIVRDFLGADGSDKLLKFVLKREREQKEGYRKDKCLQGKEHDDIAAVNIIFKPGPNPLDALID